MAHNKTLILNGVETIAPKELKLSYKRLDREETTKRDAYGLMHIDTIRDKIAVLTVTYGDKIPVSKASVILNAIKGNEVMATFFDTYSQSYVTKKFYPSDRDLDYYSSVIDGTLTYSNISFTLTEY